MSNRSPCADGSGPRDATGSTTPLGDSQPAGTTVSAAGVTGAGAAEASGEVAAGQRVAPWTGQQPTISELDTTPHASTTGGGAGRAGDAGDTGDAGRPEGSGGSKGPSESEGPGPGAPAPIIELDSVAGSEPVKPLGPRRLARLQREMAEHARELAEAEAANQGAVDEDLLAKQQRFAELAQRAAAANPRDREDAERAIRIAEAASDGGAASNGGRAADGTAVASGGAASGGTGVSSGGAASGSGVASDSAAAPGTGRAAGADAGSGANESGTQTVTVTFPQRPTAGVGLGDRGVAVDPAVVEPTATGVVRQIQLFTGTLDTIPVLPATVVERAPASELPQPGTGTEASEAGAGTEGGDVVAPAAPVRAVDSQGLELMDPHDYKKRPGLLGPLLVLLFLAIAALIVVLVLFVF